MYVSGREGQAGAGGRVRRRDLGLLLAGFVVSGCDEGGNMGNIWGGVVIMKETTSHVC